MYQKFIPKMNDICAEKILLFLFAPGSILNLVIFSMKVIFGKRELLVPADPSKSSFEKFANG